MKLKALHEVSMRSVLCIFLQCEKKTLNKTCVIICNLINNGILLLSSTGNMQSYPEPCQISSGVKHFEMKPKPIAMVAEMRRKRESVKAVVRDTLLVWCWEPSKRCVIDAVANEV